MEFEANIEQGAVLEGDGPLTREDVARNNTGFGQNADMVSYIFTNLTFTRGVSLQFDQAQSILDDSIFEALKSKKQEMPKSKPEAFYSFTTNGVELCGEADLVSKVKGNFLEKLKEKAGSNSINADEEETVFYNKKDILGGDFYSKIKEGSEAGDNLKVCSLSSRRPVKLVTRSINSVLSKEPVF